MTDLPSPGRGFAGLVRRDLLLAFRQPAEVINPALFFVMATALVPLGIGPDPARLAAAAPGMIWIMALLAALLAMDSLFQSDFRDGALEQMIVSPQPLWLLVTAKMLVHWLVTGVPLTLLAPLLAVMLALPAAGCVPLVVGLAIGTAIFSVVGAVGAALTLAARGGGVLLSLVVMPLYVPVLIFGVNAVQQASDGFSSGAALSALAALLAMALLVSPFAAAAALKIGLQG